jgi:hypothetical protein
MWVAYLQKNTIYIYIYMIYITTYPPSGARAFNASMDNAAYVMRTYSLILYQSSH